MKKQLLNIKDFVHINLSRGDKSDVLTDDLVNAEKRVEILKQTCQNSEKKIAACLQTASSGNDPQPSDKRLKKMPEMHLFHCFNELTESLGNDTVLGLTLNECCTIQGAIAKELLNYELEVEKQCITSLNNFMENDLPSVNKYRKQLNKATADMDNYRIRYHTALKQMQQSSSSSGINGARAESLKKELEEATTKVDQCRDALAAEMFALLSREPEFAQVFVQYYRLQTQYHRKVLDLLETSLPDLENVISNTAQKPVFGTPLDEHLRVTERDIAVTLETCIGWLLNHIREEGLLRIPGSSSKVKMLKSAFDAGIISKIIDIDEYARDPHTVAGTLKSYLRELPEPLLTYQLYEEWISAARIPEPEMRLKNLWQTCNKLPKANFENLKYLVKFLAKLATNSETNKMSIQNVAIAIAPSLIWAPKANDAAFEMNMTSANLHNVIIDSLLNFADWFFPGDVNFVQLPINDHYKQNNVTNGELHPETNSTCSNSTNSLNAAVVKTIPRTVKKPAPPVPPPPSTLSEHSGNAHSEKPPIERKPSLDTINKKTNFQERQSKPEGTANQQSEAIPSPELVTSGEEQFDRRSEENFPVNGAVKAVDNSVISVGSLDRKQNKIASDPTKPMKPVPLDRKSIQRNKQSIEKPNVPTTERKLERPISFLERPNVPPPERPRRSNSIKDKQKSLENLTEGHQTESTAL